LAQAFFFQIVGRSDRRKRRREILLLLAQCADLVFEAARSGTIAAQWSEPSGSHAQGSSEKYWEFGTKALGLFEVREQVVARWTEVELHAGLLGYFHLLEDHNVPREKLPAQQFLGGYLWEGSSLDESFEYEPPRASMLSEWVELRSLGPLYG
jgi:hypothetical protein